MGKAIRRAVSYLIAASLLTPAVPAAAATFLDYSVFATNDVTIAGGFYGTIASGTFDTSHAVSGGNYVSWVQSTADQASQAAAFSRMPTGLAPTGTFALTGPTRGTLNGAGAGIDVFTVTGADFASLIRLTFVGVGEGTIVNVSGDVPSAPSRYDFAALAARNIIFNFVNATSVSFAGADVRGSILAPRAAVSYAGGTIADTVAADSFSSAGTEIGGIAFTAQATSGVPEPAAWAMMMIAGFGAIGAVLRRARVGSSISLRETRSPILLPSIVR